MSWPLSKATPHFLAAPDKEDAHVGLPETRKDQMLKLRRP